MIKVTLLCGRVLSEQALWRVLNFLRAGTTPISEKTLQGSSFKPQIAY